jgi:Flp pilus assembly protein TadB
MSEMRDRDQERGYKGTTGRLSDTYRSRTLTDPKSKSRQTRQILSGAEIRPPSRANSSYPATNASVTPSQLTYAVALGILLVLGLLLWLIFGMGVASIIFFLLALGLLGGWLAF